MRCNARLAFVLWGIGEELVASCGLESERPVSKLVWHGPAGKSLTGLKGGAGCNSGQRWVLRPAHVKSTRSRISLWSKRGDPKIEKLNFGTWLNKNCATRTKLRRHAPLTRC